MKVAEGVRISGCIVLPWERAMVVKNARRRMEKCIVAKRGLGNESRFC